MSSSTESLSIFTTTLQVSSALEGIAHELLALGLFAFSFLFWHYKTRRHSSVKCAGAGVQPAPRFCPDAKRAAKTKSANTDEDLPRRLSSRGRDPEELEERMLNLLHDKEFTRALYIWRGLERNGREVYIKNEELFSAFAVSAVRVEKFDIVEKMLRTAQKNGIELTSKSWRTLLKMLSTKKRFSTCLVAYSIYEGRVPEDQVVYSCLINAALDSNQPAEAAKMLPRYKASEIEPKDWILFFRTYAAVGDVDSAEETFLEIGFETSSLMLNLLLLTCVNANQPERAQKCLEKAHELEDSGGPKIVNVVSYNTLIKGFAQEAQIEKCFICLQGLLEHGFDADDATLGVLVDLCIQEGFADRLVEFLKKTTAPSTTVMCTHFLKLLIKTNKLEDALLLYQDMKCSEQTRPDIVTCSILIKAFINERDLDRAVSIVDDMIATGCYPDDLILTRMLDGYRQAGLCDKGVALFDRFVKLGVVPSDYTILTLLKLYGIGGNHDAAYELVATCVQRFGMRPSVIHFTCLMSGAIRTRNYEQAWKAYLLMCSHGVKADDTSMSILLPGLVASQRWDRVVEIISSALKADPPMKIPPEMLNNALSQAISSRGAGQYAQRLQVLMQGAGVPITARNAQRLQHYE